MLGILLAFLAPLGFGSGAIFARIAVQRTKPSVVTTISLISSLGITAIFALIVNGSDILKFSPLALLWFAILGIVTFPLARLLNYTSVGMLGAARSSSLIACSPLFATGLAILFTTERLNWPIAISTLTIVSGIIIIVSERRNGPA